MAEQLKAGVAKVDITPPIGVTMAGYGGRDHPAEGVMAPLYAYAIALEQGDEACAIVVGDLIGIHGEVIVTFTRACHERILDRDDCEVINREDELHRARIGAAVLDGGEEHFADSRQIHRLGWLR